MCSSRLSGPFSVSCSRLFRPFLVRFFPSFWSCLGALFSPVRPFVPLCSSLYLWSFLFSSLSSLLGAVLAFLVLSACALAFPGQLNLLCKNAIFKGVPGNLWGRPHGRSPEDVKDTPPGASKGQNGLQKGKMKPKRPK